MNLEHTLSTMLLSVFGKGTTSDKALRASFKRQALFFTDLPDILTTNGNDSHNYKQKYFDYQHNYIFQMNLLASIHKVSIIMNPSMKPAAFIQKEIMFSPQNILPSNVKGIGNATNNETEIVKLYSYLWSTNGPLYFYKT